MSNACFKLSGNIQVLTGLCFLLCRSQLLFKIFNILKFEIYIYIIYYVIGQHCLMRSQHGFISTHCHKTVCSDLSVSSVVNVYRIVNCRTFKCSTRAWFYIMLYILCYTVENFNFRMWPSGSIIKILTQTFFKAKGHTLLLVL